MGAIVLAICYHVIMYYYLRDKLLLNYLAFLCASLLFVFNFSGLPKVVFDASAQGFIKKFLTEPFQITYMVCYVFFIVKALKLSPRNKPFLYYLWLFGNLLDFLYVILIVRFIAVGNDYHDHFLFGPIRIIGLIFILIILFGSLTLRNLTFERIILYGAFANLLFYVASMYAHVNFDQNMLIFPPEYLIIGIFVDILFFSSALNFRARKQSQLVHRERLEAANQIIGMQMELISRQNALEDERTRIAADMHDDLGSELTKINYLSQMAMNAENTAENLEKIKHTAGSLVENMSNLIWAMKEENNSLHDLIAYLKIYSYDYLENNGIQLKFEVDEWLKDAEIKGDLRRNIFLAVKEILHNVVKHSQANLVEISVENNENLRLKIRDYGIGFSAQDLHRKTVRNGLINIKKRIEKIGGKATLHSEPGKTEHIFEIPI